MFELRCRGTVGDHEIVEEINKLGFKTRIKYVRDPKDRTKILREHGGNPLNIKGLWQYVQNPIYAGVSGEKWTKDQRIKAKFNGIVSIGTFNTANKGKNIISEENGVVKFYQRQPPEYLVKKGVRNPDFSYKRVVMCPQCEKPFFGSASKGRLGIYYPAYHCNKRGHYYRVPKKDFEETIVTFVKSIHIAPGFADELTQTVVDEWEKRTKEMGTDKVNIDEKIGALRTQSRMTVDKIKLLTSEVAIKYLEEDIVKAEHDIAQLLLEKEKAEQEKPTDIW